MPIGFFNGKHLNFLKTINAIRNILFYIILFYFFLLGLRLQLLRALPVVLWGEGTVDLFTHVCLFCQNF